MVKTARLSCRGFFIGLGFATFLTPAFGGETAPFQWHPGMTATFSGFLCNQPVDAVHGLIAALEIPGSPAIAAYEKVESPLHCFYSDGPLKFLGRIPDSRVFVDPDKGRFAFVSFDIGGNVVAYSWVAEGFVSDTPYEAEPPISL